MRMLLRDTRHTEVMALWGRVWMWHAFLVFVLFLASNVLIWAGTRRAEPYVALWAIGLLCLMIPAWYYRFRDGPALTPIERRVIDYSDLEHPKPEPPYPGRLGEVLIGTSFEH